MLQGSADYIDDLLGILTALAAFYPSNHFGGKSAREYFSEVISSRFTWHRAHLEPDGPGTRAPRSGRWQPARSWPDVEKMIVDLVGSLSWDTGTEFEFDKWKAAWDAAAT